MAQQINYHMTPPELHRTLAANSPMTIIERNGARAESSRGIYEGDTVRERVHETQKPTGNVR